VNREGTQSTVSPALPAPRYPRAWLLAAVLLVTLRGVALVLSVPAETVLTGDEPYYDALARTINATHTYVHKGEPDIHRPPGWPVTLATIYRFFGDSRRTVVACQTTFDALTIVLCGWLAGRLFGSRKAGLVAFLLALVWPPWLREARLMGTEPLFTTFTTLLLVAFYGFVMSPSWRTALLSGVVAGLSALVRPTGLVTLAGLGLGWLIQRRGRFLADVPRFLVMLLGVVLVVGPWTLRNYRVSHHVVPVAVGSGEQFYLGSVIETEGRWDHRTWWRLRDNAIREAEAAAGRPLDAFERDHVWMEHGLAIWRAHPAQSLWISIKRFWRLILLPVLGPGSAVVRFGFFAVLLVLYALALPRGFEGLRAGDHATRYAGILLVAVVFFVGVSSAIYTISRFLEPLRSVFLILAAGTLARPLARRRE